MAGVLFRVDAGPRRGLGHLRRSLALAATLARRGAGVTVLAEPHDDVRGRVEAAGCRLAPLVLSEVEAGRPRDLEQTIAAARVAGADTIVVDSYDVTSDGYLAALRSTGVRVVAMDDAAGFPLSAHLVVNGAVGAETLPYRSVTGDTRFLLGPSFALLNQEYADTAVREIAPVVRTVLVAVGGADPHAMLPRVLGILDTIDAPFAITAVAGPFLQSDDQLRARVTAHGLVIARAPGTLRDLMLAADLAVSAAGQTVYELAATGTPTVAIQLAGNQAQNMRGLVHAGVVADGGAAEDPRFATVLTAAVLATMTDVGARAGMSRIGQRLVDGRGASRVADAMAA